MHAFILLVALSCLLAINAFTFPRFRIPVKSTLYASSGDPLDAIRAKMASDPSYNPMQDQQAMQILESKIPSEVRDVSNAVERLRVAIKDATEGTDAINDLDGSAAKFGGQGEGGAGLISSPQSAWFKEGQPNEKDGSFSQSRKDELMAKLKSAYPEVPLK